MHEPTNSDRADWAYAALTAFAEATGLDRSGDFEHDPAIPVSHLLCDLRHWCDGRGIDFCQCLKNAEVHYAEEVAEEADLGDCERCGAPATTETLDDETLCSECGADREAE
jgi:hypothetical protein